MSDRPNVVFVITDDQGYGDLGCHGNPIIQTPNIDELYTESVRFTNYHVGPTCAPTRAGIMTGRYCNCTGVWHTIGGRSLLREDEVTIADFFRAGGYRTGMFGKWHLGDNYPFHPHNRGFDVAVYHGGGGVHQTPDYWGNTYFNDTYFRNGEPEKFRGYCTDIWFDEAMKFIDDSGDDPFFCYIPTNAPHGPFNIADPYRELYTGDVSDGRARFFGMITNIDENVGRMREYLKEKGLDQNTIFIFMTDNGSANGCDLDGDGFVKDGYNAGLRGKKGSPYDGGHRVPFILHWPEGGYTEGRDLDTLVANVDFLPTLCDLCDVPVSDESLDHINGTSLKPLLQGESENWPDRVLVTDSQRVENPIKWRQCSTMTQEWRLVNGKELYDIQKDREQRNDVAGDHPEVVEDLRKHYEEWWEQVSTRFDEDVPIIIGSEHEPVSVITTHDWHNEDSQCAWNQGSIRQGMICNGRWAIDVSEAGEYNFELRRWPREEDRAIVDAIPGKVTLYYGGRAIEVSHARIQIDDEEQKQAIEPGDKGVNFTFQLDAGEKSLETELNDGGETSLGAYYVYAEKVG